MFVFSVFRIFGCFNSIINHPIWWTKSVRRLWSNRFSLHRKRLHFALCCSYTIFRNTFSFDYNYFIDKSTERKHYDGWHYVWTTINKINDEAMTAIEKYLHNIRLPILVFGCYYFKRMCAHRYPSTDRECRFFEPLMDCSRVWSSIVFV